MAYIEYNFPAGSWGYPTSNPAELDRDTGTNHNTFRHNFDDSTEEFILLEPAFELPSNLDTAGTIYFIIEGYAKTAASANVVFKIYHHAVAQGESWDGAYSTLSSGALSCNGTQDYLDRFSFSETVANLGWSANDLLYLKLSRDAGNASDTLTGDYCVVNVKIRIPVS